MKSRNTESRYFLFTAMVVGLLSGSSLLADENSWKDETVLVFPQEDQTVVSSVEGDKIPFQNADPQLAIEWGLAHARTTVVLAGKYMVSDRIDVPRNDVTLIIDEGAEISLNPKTEHTWIGFGSRRNPGYWQLVPMIYNLAPEPGGKTGETVDLTSRNRGIAIEQLVGERSNEIIDCNESHAIVGEIVSIGEPQKLLTTSDGSGPRFTKKPRIGSVSLDVKQKTILTGAVSATLRTEVPNLPNALPRFTLKAIVEVTFKDGSRKEYTKEVEVDVRSAEFITSRSTVVPDNTP